MPPEVQAATSAPAKPAADAAPTTAPPVAPGSTADSAPSDAKPGAKPAEKPKARDLAAVRRQGFQLRQERKEAAAAKAAADKVRADTDAALAEMRAELAKLQDQGKKHETERAEWLADPISYAEKHGRKPDEVVTGYVRKNTPEAAQADIARKLADETAAREKLEADIRARDEKSKKDEEQRQAQALVAQREGAVKGFLHAVRQAGKTYPHLNGLYEDSEIAAKAAEFQKMAIDRGEVHSFESVANAFEKFAKEAYEKRGAKLQELLIADEAEPAPAAGVQDKREPGNGRRAATTGPNARSAPKPEPPKLSRRLTRAEQDAADLAALKLATAKDRAAMKSS
jgi:hypothetical protein